MEASIEQRNRAEVLFRLPDGRYLVEEMRNPAYPDNLGLLRCPGGKIEEGELPKYTLCRELQEEYGLIFDSELFTVAAIQKFPRGVVHRYWADAPVAWIGRESQEGRMECLVVTDKIPELWGY